MSVSYIALICLCIPTLTIRWVDCLKSTCEPVVPNLDAPLIYIPTVGSLVGSTTLSYWKKRKIYQYLGIPFAEPPLGNLRFKPPEKKRGTQQGRYNATKFQRICPQLESIKDDSYMFPTTEEIEDCLYLNVFIPEQNTERKMDLLPVMFYIHGGIFYKGSPTEYCPNYLLESDVILVTIQHRLGPLGFLCLHTDDAPGNVGLLDQVLALEWVNENILYFGGDNKRVTVFGHSSGGTSVSLLMVSPAVRKDLFQQTIVLSGNFLLGDRYSNYNPVEQAKEFAKVVNCAQSNLYDLLHCLKMVPAQELIKANIYYMNMKGGGTISSVGISKPVIQKAGSRKFLTEDPFDTIENGNFMKIPTATGYAKDEGFVSFSDFYDIILNPNHNATCYEMNDCVSSDYSKNDIFYDFVKFTGLDKTYDVEMLKSLYFPKEVRGNLKLAIPALMELAGDLIMKEPIIKFIRYTYKKTPTYFHHFNYEGHLSTVVDHYDYLPYHTGVIHGDELIYLFPYKNDTLNEEESNVVRTFCSLWTSFAINNGKPDIINGVYWPPVTTDYGPYLEIDKQVTVVERVHRLIDLAQSDGKEQSKSNSTFLSFISMLIIIIVGRVFLFYRN